MQGRFKREDSAAADPELRGGTDRGSSPVRTHNIDAEDPNADRSGRRGTPGDDARARRKTSTPAGPGSRMALRNWRISTRLVSLLALPVVAATSLGGLRISTSMTNLEQLDNMKLLTEMTKQATELASALQEERDHSAGPLAAGDSRNDDVAYPRQVTDREMKAFEDATEQIKSSDSDALVGVNSSLVNILQQLDKIKTIRANAYKDDAYVAQTVNSYDELIKALLSLSQDMAQATSNSEMIRSTRALAAFSSAKEYASIQRAVISAGLAHEPKPKLSTSDRLYGQSALLSENSALDQFIEIYDGTSTSQELLQALEQGGNSEIILADTYAARMLKPNSEISKENRSYKDWYDSDSTKLEEMSRIEQTLLSEMDQKARQLRSETKRDAILNGVVILLVLGVSLIGAFVVARSMVRSLRRLQDTAQEVSQKRLPELVRQLSESDPQDVDTSVESVGVHSRDEIGKVAAAFDDVHREAVRLAADQALLRGNVNAMFTNLSRRSQGLIQRQLSLISELESREADPDQLSSLFKLDHLATRMRRNGENLLVLAGEEPGRRWTRPVPLVDVLRAAASEVEQYERIELSSVPSSEVAGRVVNDLVHLVAELLENATSFSSPQTKVKVTGHALPDGRVLVEIHDTGIGLSPEDLSAINERLASPPTVDVSVSRRMGLFVVGRLSQRHGIRIQLRPSDSGGTTALVMLPVDVAQGGRKGSGRPPGAGTGTGAASGPGSNRLAGMQPRGQVQGGNRTALPSSGDPRPQAPGDGSGPTGADSRPGRAGSGLPSRPGARNGPKPRDPAGDSLFRSGPPPRESAAQPTPPPASGREQDGRPQLPQRGPAPELPGSSSRPAGAGASGGRQDGGTSWGSSGPADGWSPAAPEPPEQPRGHDEESAASRYPRVNREAPYGSGDDRNTKRENDFEAAGPAGGSLGGPGDTAAFPRPDFGGSRQQQEPHRNQRPASEHDALPPATGPGDGRTPLFEALESDWFRGARGGEEAASQPAPPPQRRSPAPEGPPAMPRREPARNIDDTGAVWRTSPNDELGRQAERVRQPAAGGITTSGLPRRVPRANLVAGTAQQQNEQTGPQVSRAPDDVRGRLTNLRRGIQRGRQAGSGPDHGNHGFGPTYQQER
ncbi:sensor histidine kinase [Streptomyces meridianus]|uniref:histidine kinase n=1 Tax=Streptomyces meridianus TaxID=2938945 RepID=A0ABT0X883_9ACTN|nr:nitrate- and nitrite sensing domain-containing protein [Streptomyces meridianus]MCM2578739.1 nitrate- and nitrite sensing domain-containing protein [Streptomyces meridianus]